MGRNQNIDQDEQLEDNNSSIVVDTEVVSQLCEVRDSNKSVDAGMEDEKTGEYFSKMSLNTEPGEESNTSDERTDDLSGHNQVEEEATFSAYIEKILAEHYHSIGYPTPIPCNDMFERQAYHEVINEKEFTYGVIFSFGLANFMSYAAHFCKHEARNKAEIISIGSGNGAVDREIICTYRKHFGEDIRITLVDPNPDHEVDFKTVDDLIEARPEAVGNCVVLIIWPDPVGSNDGYDIDAVQKLQPLAALVLYDPTGVSASGKLNEFLHNKTKNPVGCGEDESYDEYYDYNGLENYSVEKVTSLGVYCKAGVEVEEFGRKITTEPAHHHLSLRLLKLKKL